MQLGEQENVAQKLGVVHRVAVTGMGVTCALGDGLDAFFEGLWEGRCGIRPLTQLDTTPYTCKIGGEIAHVPFERVPTDQRDRASTLAIRAALEALSHARLSPDAFAALKGGAVVGTTCGGVLSLEQLSEVLVSGGDPAVIPDWQVIESTFFAATAQVARAVKATGPVQTVTIACASGAHAIGMGMDLIRTGRATVVLAGGVDVISRFIFRGFAALNGLGSEPYRAFDKNRNGVVLGEGAAFVVLESLEHARQRGVSIFAEMLGHSFNNDGAHIVNPNPTGEGIHRSFRMAIRDAHITEADIDQMNAHGTGTHANDSAEAAALRRLGPDVIKAVTSIKPMMGHTSGAAGAVELVASVLSLMHHFVPATLHYEEPDPELGLSSIDGKRRAAPMNVMLSANSGFGGSNAALVLRQPDNLEPAAQPCPWAEVVVTGLGVVHPGAASLEALWERLEGPPLVSSARPGVEVPTFDVFQEAGVPISKDARRMDSFSQLAVLAAARAIRDAGLNVAALDEEVGLVLGSTYACLESNEKFAAGLSKIKVNPVIYQNTVSNAVTGYLCITLGIRGPVSVVNSSTVAGASALAYGFDLIRTGRCQAVVVVGVEKLTGLTALGVERTQGASLTGPCRPYDPAGSGLTLADGAVAVVLEARTAAEARGASIQGRVTGYGSASAGGQTPQQAVAESVKEAARSLSSLSAGVHVYGSGSGVAGLDSRELEGMDAALETLGARASLSSVKAALGETLGASALFSLAAGLKSLETLRARGQGVAECSAETLLASHAPSGRLELILGEQALAVPRVLVSSIDPEGDCVAIGLER